MSYEVLVTPPSNNQRFLWSEVLMEEDSHSSEDKSPGGTTHLGHVDITPFTKISDTLPQRIIHKEGKLVQWKSPQNRLS